jgi:hypothetical protein
MTMNKIITRISYVVFIYGMFNCSPKAEEEISVPGMHMLDLSKYGKPFSILVPDTVKNNFQINEQPNGSLDIRSGKNFALSIFEQEADLKLKKEDVTHDDVNKLKQFVKEEPQGIIWESQIVDPEFHFLVNTPVGISTYSFEDIHDPQLNTFSRDAVEKMYYSATHLKAHSNE